MEIAILVALQFTIPSLCRCLTSIPNLNVVLNPEMTGQYVPHFTLPYLAGAARSWRTFQMRHTEMGDVRCVAGFNRYRFAWHPEMNTTAASVRACATLSFTFACPVRDVTANNSPSHCRI